MPKSKVAVKVKTGSKARPARGAGKAISRVAAAKTGSKAGKPALAKKPVTGKTPATRQTVAKRATSSATKPARKQTAGKMAGSLAKVAGKTAARTGAKAAAKAIQPQAKRGPAKINAKPRTAAKAAVTAKAKATSKPTARAKVTGKTGAAKVQPVKVHVKKAQAAKPATVKMRAVKRLADRERETSTKEIKTHTGTGIKAQANVVQDKTQAKAEAQELTNRMTTDKNEKKKPLQRQGFRTSEFIVYPAHGVGQITEIEEQEVAGLTLELFVINFEKDKMTLRVPTAKIQSVGMRKLAEPAVLQKALDTLKGRARVKRTMWSRRAQEYEAKINSGDLIAIAEVVRDLHRLDSQPEQSYSERQLYEAALDRMAREYAVVRKLDEAGAVAAIEEILTNSPKRAKAAQDEAEKQVAAA